MIVKINALLAEMIPFGISLMAVLGFFASNCLSRYRLNAIAALLAKTMQSITSMKVDKYIKYQGEELNTADSCAINPKANPINANGIAKMV